MQHLLSRRSGWFALALAWTSCAAASPGAAQPVAPDTTRPRAVRVYVYPVDLVGYTDEFRGLQAAAEVRVYRGLHVAVAAGPALRPNELEAVAPAVWGLDAGLRLTYDFYEEFDRTAFALGAYVEHRRYRAEADFETYAAPPAGGIVSELVTVDALARRQASVVGLRIRFVGPSGASLEFLGGIGRGRQRVDVNRDPYPRWRDDGWFGPFRSDYGVWEDRLVLDARLGLGWSF